MITAPVPPLKLVVGSSAAPASSPAGPRSSAIMFVIPPTLGQGSVTVTEHDLDVLRLGAAMLPLVVSDRYPRRQDLHTALRDAASILDPRADRETLLRQADHALTIFAEHLVARQGFPSAPSVAATLRRWTLTVCCSQATRQLRLAANDYRLRMVYLTQGPEGLKSYLMSGDQR